MMRLTSGVLLLGAVVAAASCNNVTGDLAQGPTRLSVTPNPAKFKLGDVSKIVVQNFDEQGSALLSDASVSGGVTGPIAVVIDTSFQPGAVQRYATQFAATATSFGVGLVSFVDAGLAARQDTLIVLPNDVNPIGTLSTTTPSVGDTVSFTVAGQFRLDTLGQDGNPVVMTIATGLASPNSLTRLQVVDLSPDSLTIRFLAPDTVIVTPGGNLVAHYDAPVNILNTHFQYSPAFPFGLLGNFQAQSSANLVLP